MPRGNDPAIAQDFRETYGVYGNAEELIHAHMAALDPAVQKASLLPIDNEATAELNLDDLSGDIDGDGEVIAAAVRGNAIVCVVEDNGRTYKTVLPADDSYKPPQAAGRHTVEAVAREDSEFRDRIAQLHAEHEKQLAREREKLDEEFQKEVAKMQEQQQKAIAKAAEQDAEDAEDAEGVDPTDTGGAKAPEGAPNDPSSGGGPKTKKSTKSTRASKK